MLFEIESVTFLWVEKVKFNSNGNGNNDSSSLTAIDPLRFSTQLLAILLAIEDMKRLKPKSTRTSIHSIGFSREQIERELKQARKKSHKKILTVFSSFALFKFKIVEK